MSTYGRVSTAPASSAGYHECMTLLLKRFEIVLVFLAAGACAYIGASWYFGDTDGAGPLFLIPRPTVLNAREALLDTLARSSQAPTATPVERLLQLSALASSSPSRHIPSSEERLKVLRQLSAGKDSSS